MSQITGDNLRGHLEPLILSALTRGDAHGFEILKRLESAGSGALKLKEGSIYPALYRLEAQGLVKAAWETGAVARRGPRRRIYHLTGKGGKRLHAARNEWEDFVRVIGGILGSSDMITIETRDLMIHVERIVRPIRATDRRKLSMRRELLAHLTAAFNEERQNAPDEGAWQAAQRRLGNPVELTRSLQRTVPFFERMLLSCIPAPRWMNRCEKKMGNQMGLLGMTLGQQALFTLGAMVITYTVAIFQALIILARYRQQMMDAMSLQTWQYKAGQLASAVLLLWLMMECFSLISAATKDDFRRGSLKPGAWIIALMIVWQADIVMFVAGRPLHVLDFLVPAAMGLFLAAALTLLGRFIRKVGVGYAEWLALDIEA